ncbi:MAG: GNAT family N-acetyltransferase [Enterobacterales bacterium]|nr:GNAT family N-acetyltransferase [Enterobacterales bacterium]
MAILTEQITLRRATADDADSVSDLIICVARAQLRNEFTQEGWELFLRLISKQTQRSIINNQDFVYWLAVTETETSCEKIVGLLSSKSQLHVFHFFILPDYQRLGIGTKLWHNYLMHIPHQLGLKITVNSSDFALAFYKQLGFSEAGKRHIKNGLAHTPMQFYLSSL